MRRAEMRHARLLVRVGVAGLAALPLTAAAATAAHAHDVAADEHALGTDPDQNAAGTAAPDPGQDTFRADDLVAGALAAGDRVDSGADRSGADQSGADQSGAEHAGDEHAGGEGSRAEAAHAEARDARGDAGAGGDAAAAEAGVAVAARAGGSEAAAARPAGTPGAADGVDGRGAATGGHADIGLVPAASTHTNGTEGGDVLDGDAADHASGPDTSGPGHPPAPDAEGPALTAGTAGPAASPHGAPSLAAPCPDVTVPTCGQAHQGEDARPRGPLTALVDGLVGPTGLLGGDGLLAGLVGGVFEGPLVAVDAEVSPQVQVGGILSRGPVAQSATRADSGPDARTHDAADAVPNR